jgi:biopolymer transport protein ExbD
MADIAFLMLVFFMVTTVIKQEKGLTILLPPFQADAKVEEVQDRNLFTIRINSFDQFLVEGQPRSNTAGLREEIKAFILNYGSIKELSDDPKSAIVSLKADRGTTQKTFIRALDEIQAAYYEIYAERAGVTAKSFRELDLSNTKQRLLYEKGRQGIPMNISIAE